MLDILTITPTFQRRARNHAAAFIRRLERMRPAELRAYNCDGVGRIMVPGNVPAVIFDSGGHPTSAALKLGTPTDPSRLRSDFDIAYEPDYNAAGAEALIYNQVVLDWISNRYGDAPLLGAADEELEQMIATDWALIPNYSNPEMYKDPDLLRSGLLYSLAHDERNARREESNHRLLQRLAVQGAEVSA